MRAVLRRSGPALLLIACEGNPKEDLKTFTHEGQSKGGVAPILLMKGSPKEDLNPITGGGISSPV